MLFEIAETFGFMEGDVLVAGERVRLKVVHNGGGEYDTRLEEEMRKCDIIALLFDITSKPTMEKLKTKVLGFCALCVLPGRCC